MIVRGPRHGERGAAMIEFALVASVLLTITFGIIDFGRALYAYSTIVNGARLGARYAIVRGQGCTSSDCPATSDSVQTYVRSQSPLLTPTDITVNTTWPGTNSTCSVSSAPYNASGCLVLVQVNYTFNFIMPLVPGGQWNLSSTSQMVVSQ